MLQEQTFLEFYYQIKRELLEIKDQFPNVTAMNATPKFIYSMKSCSIYFQLVL